jgi:hypothetical protein
MILINNIRSISTKEKLYYLKPDPKDGVYYLFYYFYKNTGLYKCNEITYDRRFYERNYIAGAFLYKNPQKIVEKVKIK